MGLSQRWRVEGDGAGFRKALVIYIVQNFLRNGSPDLVAAWRNNPVAQAETLRSGIKKVDSGLPASNGLAN